MTALLARPGFAVAFGGFLLLGGQLADAYGRARMYRIGPTGTVVRAGVTLSGCDAVCTLPNSGFCGWRTHCSAFSNA
jgi:MFS family permease